MKRSEYKVPGGKLLRAKVEVVDDTITFIQLTGDFFMTPETDLEELEAKLTGIKTDSVQIEEAVKRFFHEKSTVIAGASPSDFSLVINQALKA